MKKIIIDNHELIIAEIKLGQIKALQNFIRDMKINPDMQVEELLQNLIGRIDEFLQEIIFLDQDNAKKVNWDEVPYSTLEDIVNDFFSENVRLMKQLKNWLQIFVSQKQENQAVTISTSGQSTASSGTSPAATSSRPSTLKK